MVLHNAVFLIGQQMRHFRGNDFSRDATRVEMVPLARPLRSMDGPKSVFCQIVDIVHRPLGFQGEINGGEAELGVV